MERQKPVANTDTISHIPPDITTSRRAVGGDHIIRSVLRKMTLAFLLAVAASGLIPFDNPSTLSPDSNVTTSQTSTNNAAGGEIGPGNAGGEISNKPIKTIIVPKNETPAQAQQIENQIENTQGITVLEYSDGHILAFYNDGDGTIYQITPDKDGGNTSSLKLELINNPQNEPELFVVNTQTGQSQQWTPDEKKKDGWFDANIILTTHNNPSPEQLENMQNLLMSVIMSGQPAPDTA